MEPGTIFTVIISLITGVAAAIEIWRHIEEKRRTSGSARKDTSAPAPSSQPTPASPAWDICYGLVSENDFSLARG